MRFADSLEIEGGLQAAALARVQGGKHLGAAQALAVVVHTVEDVAQN
jgi:hypothetical protein